MGLHVRAVSVFGEKSDAVCGFLAYFCAVLRPPLETLVKVWENSKKLWTAFDSCFYNSDRNTVHVFYLLNIDLAEHKSGAPGLGC